MNRQLDKMEKAAFELDDEVQKQVGDTDSKRRVVFAFVVFSTQLMRNEVLEEYRFSTYPWLRHMMKSCHLFQGYEIQVVPAFDPSNLYWENLDYPKWKRRLRQAITAFATLIVLFVCALLITTAQSSRSQESLAPEYGVWVFDNTAVGSCFNLCSLELFTDAACTDTSRINTIKNIFDVRADGVMNADASWFAGSCKDGGASWASSACTSAGASDWIGVELESPMAVKCMRMAQLPQKPSQALRAYGCKSAPAAGDRGAWDPQLECMGMQEVYPQLFDDETGNSTALRSGRLSVVRDTTCPLDDESSFLSLEVAQEAKVIAVDDATDPTVSCFCKQQLKLRPSFLSPEQLANPVGASPEVEVCRPWAVAVAASTFRLVVGITVVVVLNFLLKALFRYFTEKEMHISQTGKAKSQFLKLFFAQFINTGLIILLVHANIEALPMPEALAQLVSIGEGRFHEPNVEWFEAVGSSIAVTSALQIVTTTMPDVLRSLFMRFCVFRWYARNRVTQDALNSVYVLPDWDLALRLAQGMNVICVIFMYGSGMPVLYYIGAVYCFVAYWVDKWSLLRGCSRPPAYSEALIVSALNLQPVMVFWHVAFAALIFSNQALLPSRWSTWMRWASWSSGVDQEIYEETQELWRAAADSSDRQELYWQWVRTRFLDLGRAGSWRVVFVLGWCTVYFVLYFLYSYLLKPMIDPGLAFARFYIAMRLKRNRCIQSIEAKLAKWSGGALTDPFHLHSKREVDPPLVDVMPKLQEKGLLSSYGMEANPLYKTAARALKQANKGLKEAAVNKRTSVASVRLVGSRKSILGRNISAERGASRETSRRMSME